MAVGSTQISDGLCGRSWQPGPSHLPGRWSLWCSRSDGVQSRRSLAGLIILITPVGSHGFGPGEKIDASLAIHMQISIERASPPSEGEERQRHWNRHIDAHHAHLHGCYCCAVLLGVGKL